VRDTDSLDTIGSGHAIGTEMFALDAKLRSVIITGTRFAAILFVALLGACASLPTDYEKEPSTAIRDTGHTQLAKKARPLVDAHAGESGFYPLPDGVEAMAVRLILIEQSDVAIDVQYYYILPDVTSALFLEYLLKAADRGVRVRILLDDISTKGYEQTFAVLSANPNIEIRLTNPFANRRTRILDGLTDFQRVNHRMHNKSITFDNTVTIIGGRNIAIEYFGAGDVFNYRDLDVLGTGQVADEVSTEFDTYWNAAEAVPVIAFVDPDGSAESAEGLQRKFAMAIEEAKTTPYIDALINSIDELLLDKIANKLVWAPSRVVFDLPYGQISAGDVAGPEVLAGLLAEAVERATEELFVISPYFVPGDSGIELFRRLRERGVRCVVVTNSLASTDVAAVYGGYKDYQKPLLEMGVELWEMMAFPDKPGHQRGASTERQSLHAKAFAIDGSQLFVGSFNWDPRSVGVNTEMGVLIESAKLASQLVNSVTSLLPGAAWQVRLNDDDKVEWVGVADDKEVVFTKPPQTSAWRRFTARATNFKVFEGQL
jgi:putative cardiolipin synthase